MKFLDLPSELIEEVLIVCDPVDVSKVAQTCISLRSLLYHSNDTKLWRELYLAQELDDPRECVGQDGTRRPTINWREDLQCIVRVRTVLDDVSTLRSQELEQILQTLMKLVCNVRPSTSEESWDLQGSKNLMWVAEKLRNGFLDHIQDKLVSPSLQSLEARLHTYFGLTENDNKRKNVAKSRGVVYLLRNYRPETDYGPLMPDGTVNWTHIRAIHHVVSTHIVNVVEEEEFQYVDFWMSLRFTQICLPTGVDLDKERDWAGVTGSWGVAFCFVDHRELLRFNEASLHEVDSSFFEDPHFHEVYRARDVKLCVARTEPDPNHPTRPVIHFFGEVPDPSSMTTMIGRVRMTTDNQIQWHYISGEQGNAIWSSEGIQVGGLRSSFGVLGSWTTVFHDTGDPVGPFWMRKYRE